MQKNKEDIPDVRREGWEAEEIAEESGYHKSDEIVREMLRGDATKGDADKRDVAGSPDSEDTDYGRKQTKKNN